MASESHSREFDSVQGLFALIENAPVGAYLIDSQFRLVALNKRAEPVFDNIQPLIGRGLEEIARISWPEEVITEGLAHFRHALATGESYVAPTLTGPRKDLGHIVSYDWQVHRVTLPDGSFGVICYFQDLTAVRYAEAVVERTTQREAFLSDLGQRLRPLSEPNEIMAAAAELLARQLGVASAGYCEVAADSESILVGGQYRDGRLPENMGRYRFADFGGWGPVLRAGDEIFTEDALADPLGPPGGTATMLAFQVRAAAATPLLKNGKLVAFLYLSHDQPRAWPDWERKLLREIADQTWAAVERARAESELRRRTNQFESIFAHAPLGVYLVDPDLRILQVNPAARAVLGNTPDLVGCDLGPLVRRLWSDRYADELVRLFQRTLETGESYVTSERDITGERAEQRADHDNDDDFFEWRIDRVTLPDGRYGVACYFRDVTASVRARAAIAASEAALRASEERHAFLLALSDTVRTLIDPLEIQAATARALGRHLGVSRAFYGEMERRADGDYYVVGPDYCANASPSVHTRPTPLGLFRASDFGVAYIKELRAGSTVVLNNAEEDPRLGPEERRSYTEMKAHVGVPLIKQGQQVAFMAVQNAQPRQWTADEVALVQDAAERTWAAIERARAEASLRDSQARLQLALDASDMGTFVWHVEDDRGEPDARTLALFGQPATGTLNLGDVLGAVHPDDRARSAAAIQNAIDPEHPGIVRDDFRVVNPDGSVHWLAITAQVVSEDTSRGTRRMVGIMADISARKQIEQTLREREELLKDSDRRKDEFLAMLAHELRNPLAPIRTGLEMLRIAVDKPDAIERVRIMMERQVGHMVRLVDDLLDVSRITSGKIRLQRQPSVLATLINTAVEANRAALNSAQIDLRVKLPDEPVQLDVDPTRFVQIVSNLLHNAVKFTKAQGQVGITAQVEPAIDGGTRRLSLSVADSGVGISHEMLPRVFDLFVQGDGTSSQPGLGIGLALARRLVEMHGGSIEATSPGPGQGSAFTIRLPLPAAPKESSNVRPQQPKEIKRHVLVIDDNEDSADMTAMFVSALGAESRVAYDGESGLSLMHEFHPDVVLLDIGMPGIDGYETCRRIRQSLGSDVFVVAMTGWGQERDKQQARNAGFNAHLTKPVDPAMLKNLLGQTAHPD
jgi:PAS domain S-box-containing protein